MKGVEVEEFRDVEVYRDEELFVVVVWKNFKLCLDRLQCIRRQATMYLSTGYSGCDNQLSSTHALRWNFGLRTDFRKTSVLSNVSVF
ncbi:hypothetical protein Taro_010728 [Colocasia esculenta]|uniref:Uncharacterized protein n=1 Tax=Colocasia esculenta TaxID=4460 RepID=A0A843U912_COLES|nr:hypothetical protein [Colocasia esculenta]